MFDINIINLVSFLKKYNIKKIVVIRGDYNKNLIEYLSRDDYFEMHYLIDERSACYYACGISEERKDPVMISCDSSISSRNLASGLTEAYNKQLPLLVVKSCDSQKSDIIDKCILKDTLKMLREINDVHNHIQNLCNLTRFKQVFYSMFNKGQGPVQINLFTASTYDDNVEIEVPNFFIEEDNIEKIVGKKIAIVLPDKYNCTLKVDKYLNEFMLKTNCSVFASISNNFHGNFFPYNVNDINQILEQYDSVIFFLSIPKKYRKSKTTWIISEVVECIDLNKVDSVYQMSIEKFLVKILQEEYNFIKAKNTTTIIEINDTLLNVYNEIINNLNQEATIFISCPKFDMNLLHRKNHIRFIINDEKKALPISMLLGISLGSGNKKCFGAVSSEEFMLDVNTIGNRCVNGNFRLIVIAENSKKDFILEYAKDLGYDTFHIDEFAEANSIIKKFINSTNKALMLIHKE